MAHRANSADRSAPTARRPLRFFDHVAIRGVQVATASASDDRASIAGSVAAGAAMPAGRSPAGTLARLGDGNAGSAAETGSNPLPLDPILRPNIAPPFALPHATPDRRPDWQARMLTSTRVKGHGDRA
jgi:hypothetical protein